MQHYVQLFEYGRRIQSRVFYIYHYYYRGISGTLSSPFLYECSIAKIFSVSLILFVLFLASHMDADLMTCDFATLIHKVLGTGKYIKRMFNWLLDTVFLADNHATVIFCALRCQCICIH